MTLKKKKKGKKNGTRSRRRSWPKYFYPIIQFEEWPIVNRNCKVFHRVSDEREGTAKIFSSLIEHDRCRASLSLFWRVESIWLRCPPIFINTLYICDDRLDVAVLFVLERVPDRALNSALSRRSPGFPSLLLRRFLVVSVGSRRMSRMNRPIAAGLAHTSKRGKRTLCTVEWGTELRAQSASDDNAARYYARFAVTHAVP